MELKINEDIYGYERIPCGCRSSLKSDRPAKNIDYFT